jgi:excisionase family DNA binding protein
MENLLTADQVAVRLGLHPDQIYYHARMGHIPSVRIGRSVWFVEDQIDRWLETGGTAIPDRRQSDVPAEEVSHE